MQIGVIDSNSPLTYLILTINAQQGSTDGEWKLFSHLLEFVDSLNHVRVPARQSLIFKYSFISQKLHSI